MEKEDYLPSFNNVKNEFSEGRNVYEGYQRGWGLQFGDLREKILNDPLYIEALEVAKGRTIVAEDNRLNIFLILKYFLPKIPVGHIVEFGSYKGGMAIFTAYIVNKLYPGTKVYSLDTFIGMPATDKNRDLHNKGDFSGVDYQELVEYTEDMGLSNLFFVKGLFEKTAINILDQVKRISLCHIDCDIYTSVSYAYETTKSYMVPRGYIVFDDACFSSCIGATDVVEKQVIMCDKLLSEQIYPHFVFRAP